MNHNPAMVYLDRKQQNNEQTQSMVCSYRSSIYPHPTLWLNRRNPWSAATEAPFIHILHYDFSVHTRIVHTRKKCKPIFSSIKLQYSRAKHVTVFEILHVLHLASSTDQHLLKCSKVAGNISFL